VRAIINASETPLAGRLALLSPAAVAATGGRLGDTGQVLLGSELWLWGPVDAVTAAQGRARMAGSAGQRLRRLPDVHTRPGCRVAARQDGGREATMVEFLGREEATWRGTAESD